MFKIVTPANRADHRGLLDAMHEMRYRVVVEKWGWDIPGIQPGYDKDQFDSEDTVYVIVQNAAGEVVGTSRLNPTTTAHMMSELFADRCDLQPFPRGPDVWECSRFVTDRVRMTDPVEDFQIRCRVGIGLIAWSLDHEITRLSWLTHQKAYALVQKVWKTEPLGLPWREGNDWAWIPAVSEVDQETLDRQLDRFRNAETIVARSQAPGQARRAAGVAR